MTDDALFNQFHQFPPPPCQSHTRAHPILRESKKNQPPPITQMSVETAWQCVMAGDIEGLERALDAGCSPNSEAWTPLFHYVRVRVPLFCEAWTPRFYDVRVRVPLFFIAVQHRLPGASQRLPMLRLMQERGADIGMVDRWGFNLLFTACLADDVACDVLEWVADQPQVDLWATIPKKYPSQPITALQFAKKLGKNAYAEVIAAKMLQRRRWSALRAAWFTGAATAAARAMRV